MSASVYLKKRWLRDTLVKGPPVYLAIHEAANGYQVGQRLHCLLLEVDDPDTALIRNADVLEYRSTALEDVRVVAFSLWDLVSGGNLLWSGSLIRPSVLEPGNFLRFEPETITFGLED